MSMTLSKVTSKILNQSMLKDERLEYISKLEEVDIIELERRFLLVSNAIKTLFSRISDEKEREIFVEFIREIGILSEKSDVLSEKFTRVMFDLIDKNKDNLDEMLIIELLRSVRWALRKNPWKIFDFTKLIYYFLEKYPDSIAIKEATLEFIGEISWEVPYIIHDLEDYLKTWLFSENEELQDSVISTLTKAGKRSFYAVKSFVNEVLEHSEFLEKDNILTFLTTTPIPKEHSDIAQRVISILDLNYIGVGIDSEKRSKGFIHYAYLVRRAELKELQKVFLERLVSELAVEVDPKVKRTLIEASVIPSWHIDIELDDLVNTLIDIMNNPAENDDVRISAVRSLMQISALRYAYADRYGSALILTMDTPLSYEAKREVLNAVEFMLRVVRFRETISKLIERLIRITGDVTEQLDLTIRASNILISASKRYPHIMAEFLPEIRNVFQAISNWAIRDSLVKIAGETLRRIDYPEENGVRVILDALRDEDVQQLGLEYFHYLSFKYPQEMAKYLDELYDFIKILRDYEKSLLEEQNIEGYYSFIETPLRYFIKSLLNIVINEPSSLEKVIDLLTLILSTERNEIIIRDLAIVFDEIVNKYPQAREIIASKEIPENTKEILRRNGFNI